ncbi:MAG TPA: sugar ABC transporter substrate-binding protein [Pseudolysinimonas sp.]|nr:sugar ABC transporter substrate-binding protein [Pseudolysinimonas sp.]
MKSVRVRRLAVAALAIFALPVLAACATGGGSDNSKGIRIAFLTFVASDYSSAEKRGIESVVKPAGGSVTLFSANFDPQQQLSQCQDAITSKRFDAIVLSPVSSTTGVPCVKAAEAADIPVGTIETAVGKEPFQLKPQVKGVVAVVATTRKTILESTDKLVSLACGDANPCKVIAEIASAADPYTNFVADGVAKDLGPRVQIVQRFSTGYDPGEVAKQLPDILSAHPDATVFMSAADSSALAALPAVKDAGRTDTLKILGSGGSSDGAAAVADGTIFATSGNWPQQSGAFLAKALTQAVHGEKVTHSELDGFKADNPQFVTKETVSEFKPEWGAAAK